MRRSEVWGKDWKEKIAKEHKEEYMFKVMKKLSDKYVSERAFVEKRYASKDRLDA
jgi:uracil DNA glycosylase